jgi:hypothetical protein
MVQSQASSGETDEGNRASTAFGSYVDRTALGVA